MTFLLQIPMNDRVGIAPVECTHRCLYTQVKPCREIYPGNRDFWCGFCSDTNAIPVQTAGLPRDAEEEEEQRRILRQADELARALGVSSARAMYVGLGEGRHVRSLVITFEDAERIAKRLGGL